MEHQQLAQRLAQHLGLLFIAEPGPHNVCFAHDPTLRPEFRQSFTRDDLLNYLQAGTDNLPADTTEFWQLVEQGRLSRLRDR